MVLRRAFQHRHGGGGAALSGQPPADARHGSGDVFLLFIDGSVEAETPGGVPFGIKRLAASFDRALDGPMAAMPAKIVCDVSFFQKCKPCDDDVCIVAIEACDGGAPDSW
jgi:hypothetical protein